MQWLSFATVLLACAAMGAASPIASPSAGALIWDTDSPIQGVPGETGLPFTQKIGYKCASSGCPSVLPNVVLQGSGGPQFANYTTSTNQKCTASGSNSGDGAFAIKCELGSLKVGDDDVTFTMLTTLPTSAKIGDSVSYKFTLGSTSTSGYDQSFTDALSVINPTPPPPPPPVSPLTNVVVEPAEVMNAKSRRRVFRNGIQVDDEIVQK